VRTLPKRAENQGAEVSFMSPFTNNKQAWCGHSIDVNRPPRTNCNQCWAFFFFQNKDFTQAVGTEIVKLGGEKTVSQMYGDKFLKKAKWFFTAVATAKEAADQVNKEIEEEQLANTEVNVVVNEDGTTMSAPLEVTE
jgi:hypothetical protein